MQDIGWELYRSFLGVLKGGSLSAAARSLGLTQPTIGRHIAALEKALGSVLFTRSPTGLLPTETARSLEIHAETMQETAAALRRAATLKSEGVQGTVRITASEIVGVEVLPGALADLHARHAGLKIELLLSNELKDLLRREADIAVRMAMPTQQQLIARRIGSIEVGLYAHRDYLGARGSPQSVRNLSEHKLIGFDRATAFIRNVQKRTGVLDRDQFTTAVDSDVAQLALLRAGAGIGPCQVPIASRDAALQRVLPKHFSLNLEVWITMHQNLSGVPACRVVFDSLVACLKRHVASVGGRSRSAVAG
jgi:DNA-binding transcriptional LysR family regulator